jgi:hypothetical protein
VSRSLETAEAVLGGISVVSLAFCDPGVSPMEIATAMRPSHSLSKVRSDLLRQSNIRIKLDPVLFKVETLSSAIRAVNWSWRNWQAQTSDPGRDRLAHALGD